MKREIKKLKPVSVHVLREILLNAGLKSPVHQGVQPQLSPSGTTDSLCVCISICVHWRLEVNTKCLNCSPCVLRQVLLLNLERVHLNRLVGQSPRYHPLSTSSTLGLPTCAAMASLLHGAGAQTQVLILMWQTQPQLAHF